MVLRSWVIYLLLHLTGKVSLQNSADKIDSVVGDSVILPCLYENQQRSTDVLWRHNVSRRVLNIINGKPSTEKQDDMFKNRTESFPSEYSKGNYSIELKDLKLTHAGNYTCFFPKLNEKKMLQLVVREKPVEPTRKPRNSSTEAQSLKILTFLIALVGLTLHLI
ncbi:CD276 antigen homolog [Sinocyclocheilus anshuiensis]|uniref:CD276 antigen homolog n=1 Tax=Sinocyclocheilus anshuiensis TaxID=1608454 RepID=A0A671QH52_9TELE|nr:PREDICTED: CD276 antigen homolog [Sinocyclocheilus anshuiensis]